MKNKIGIALFLIGIITCIISLLICIYPYILLPKFSTLPIEAKCAIGGAIVYTIGLFLMGDL